MAADTPPTWYTVRPDKTNWADVWELTATAAALYTHVLLPSLPVKLVALFLCTLWLTRHNLVWTAEAAKALCTTVQEELILVQVWNGKSHLHKIWSDKQDTQSTLTSSETNMSLDAGVNFQNYHVKIVEEDETVHLQCSGHESGTFQNQDGSERCWLYLTKTCPRSDYRYLKAHLIPEHISGEIS